MVYGSLHFITFDGSEYTFKALGVFVIVRLSSTSGSNIFTLQGATDVLHTHGKARRVPTLARLAAFHQGIGKVRRECVCVCVCVLCLESVVVCVCVERADSFVRQIVISGQKLNTTAQWQFQDQFS